VIEELVESSGLGMGKYVHPMRLALTGKSVGPGLFELAELLGKDDCQRRMNAALSYMKSNT
jgi:glutamyl-tRNA synthetase